MNGPPVPQPAQGTLMLRPGDPIGHFLGPTGSLGLKVRRIGDTVPLCLSCSHVLARCGYATTGDTIETAGNPGDLTLTKPVGQLQLFTTLSSQAQNAGDFAVADFSPSVLIEAEIPGIGTPQSISQVPALNFDVYKNVEVQRLGAECHLQHGVVVGCTGPVYVQNLPVFGPTLVEYSDAIEYSTLCDHGDSGSAVVVAATGEVLGIHIGGDPQQRIGYFCPVWQFMSQFGLELWS